MIYEKMTDDAYLKHKFASDSFSEVVRHAYGEETDRYYDSDLLGYVPVNAGDDTDVYFIEIDGHSCLPIRIEMVKAKHITDVSSIQYTMRLFSKVVRLCSIHISLDILERLIKGDIPSLRWTDHSPLYTRDPYLFFEDKE